jgi:ribonucleoside-diphosphate reductase alpha chain
MEKYFPSSYEEFIYKRTYSRFIDKLNRRENWEETVNRYADFFRGKLPTNGAPTFEAEYNEAIAGILTLEEMPSMRALWAAGPALERDNISGYNCSYLVVDSPAAFSELLYILMNGAGAGWSVERQFVSKLPAVPAALEKTDNMIIVADSKLGWAKAAS